MTGAGWLLLALVAGCEGDDVELRPNPRPEASELARSFTEPELVLDVETGRTTVVVVVPGDPIRALHLGAAEGACAEGPTETGGAPGRVLFTLDCDAVVTHDGGHLALHQRTAHGWAERGRHDLPPQAVLPSGH